MLNEEENFSPRRFMRVLSIFFLFLLLLQMEMKIFLHLTLEREREKARNGAPCYVTARVTIKRFMSVS